MNGPHPGDADGFRAAWVEAQQRWTQTLVTARTLDEELLHVRVDGEWSFVQTLRHLLFVTDSWVGRGILGEQDPWHHLDLPPTGMTRVTALADADERAELADVLALRDERLATVDRVLGELTDAELDEERRCVGTGHPKAGLWSVRRCLSAQVSEEWRHRDYAERDLAVLVAGGS
ncbi:MAG TPA: DinB family protein [Nocardioides sp.]|uniref:DinB family protein n=1 Tax=Nocardioides sp. TaxID=35761 RepID=UPI002E346FD8|nr:DinB family protein [Nocardioides sp.]HEX5090647.1 DinB family protein [Nocardioides sp.]